MRTIPEQIILRSISKTATPVELKILNAWLKEAPGNIACYSQMEEIWYSKEKITQEEIRAGWQRLAAGLKNSPRKEDGIKNYARRSRLHTWGRYAAAVFIGVLISSALWVIYQNRGQTGHDSGLMVRNVVYNRTGVQQIILPDSSKVWINEDSKLTYPDVFPEGKRVVSLEGKAFFDVSKEPEKPFVVCLSSLDVRVTGTEFYIESSKRETFVTLISGGVNLATKNKRDNSFSLEPGQTGTLNNLSGEVEISSADIGYYVAWKDGVYRFNNESLGTIIGMIEKRYGYRINAPASLKDKKFTGRISVDDPIENILQTINKSYSIRYKVTGNKVEIREK